MKGNFGPALLAIKMKYKPIDSKDEYNYTLLMHCAALNLRDIGLFLLNNGADVNTLNSSLQTPIMLAVNFGHYQMFKLLYERGSDLFCEDNN